MSKIVKVVKLICYGDPVPKGRPRGTITKSGESIFYTPIRTAREEKTWQTLFIESEQPPFPETSALRLEMTAYIARPKSKPKRVTQPITKPDLDNIVKLVMDALEGLAYRRDSQIVEMSLRKEYVVYPDPARVEIEIREISGA